MSERTPFRLAPRDVDPLSWFTGPYVPLVFAALVVFDGVLLTVITFRVVEQPIYQVLGVAIATATCLTIQYMTSRPARSDNALGVVAVTGGGIALILSAYGYSGAAFPIENWWAPLCYSLVLSCIVPYLAPWRILMFGAIALVTAVPIAYLIIAGDNDRWAPVAGFLFVATPVALGVCAGTAFAFSVVSQVLPVVDNRSTSIVSEALEADPGDEEAERMTLAAYTARAVPFLRGIAERGTVEPHDRVVAGEIARHLRDDLVSRSDLVWLGLRADDHRVVVIDPEGRAATMRSAQRTAIRDVVRAVLDDPATDASSMLIELRAEAGGATAVAITLDTQLPEGRRVRHLAPYYFNLRGEMSDVRLSRDRLSFTVPPRDPGR